MRVAVETRACHMSGATNHSRRALALALGGWMLAAASGTRAQSHASLGPVEPRRTPPDHLLTLHDKRQLPLSVLLQGQVSVVQLMFTGCSAVCPLQGAQFAALEARLRAMKLNQVQLLSISIDPLSDDAAALAAWRRKFSAGPRWLAAAPAVKHSRTLMEFFQAKNKSREDAHTAQTYLFDAQGRQAFAFAELASAADVAATIAALVARA